MGPRALITRAGGCARDFYDAKHQRCPSSASGPNKSFQVIKAELAGLCEARATGQSPVAWPVVQAAIADKRAIFSRDLAADGFADRGAAAQVVMVVPIVPPGD